MKQEDEQPEQNPGDMSASSGLEFGVQADLTAAEPPSYTILGGTNVWIPQDNQNTEAFNELTDALDTLVEWANTSVHPSEKAKVLAALFCLQAMVSQGGIWSQIGIYAGTVIEDAVKEAVKNAVKDAFYEQIKPPIASLMGWIVGIITGTSLS